MFFRWRRQEKVRRFYVSIGIGLEEKRTKRPIQIGWTGVKRVSRMNTDARRRAKTRNESSREIRRQTAQTQRYVMVMETYHYGKFKIQCP